MPALPGQTHVVSRRLARLVGTLLTLAVLVVACGTGASDQTATALPATEASASTAIDAASERAASLVTGPDLVSSELIDTASGQVTSVPDLVTGDRPVLLWYWAPTCNVCLREAEAMERFARDHAAVVQVIGVGAQGDYADTQAFIGTTGVNDLPLLWQPSIALWKLNDVNANSQIQLFSYDLEHRSEPFFLDDRGRSIVLEAAVQAPYVKAASVAS